MILPLGLLLAADDSSDFSDDFSSHNGPHSAGGIIDKDRAAAPTNLDSGSGGIAGSSRRVAGAPTDVFALWGANAAQVRYAGIRVIVVTDVVVKVASTHRG